MFDGWRVQVARKKGVDVAEAEVWKSGGRGRKEKMEWIEERERDIETHSGDAEMWRGKVDTESRGGRSG